jgi:hypothetical protein
MDEAPNRSLALRGIHGVCGAFLAALTAIPELVGWFEIHWAIVCACAAMGFLLGWFFGDEALSFLRRHWWWWW